jgi:pyridoxamine 5'-phosphate oxidase
MQAELAARVDAGEIPLECPEDWGGWLVRPRAIEFWQGRPSRLHDRFRYRLDDSDGSWTIERLAP